MEKKKNIPELRFPEFKGEWENEILLNLSENGFSNGIFNDPNKVGKGYKIINVKDMYIGDEIDVNNLTLVDIDAKEFNNNKVEYGDIFFTRSSLVKEGIAYSNINMSDAKDLTYDGHLIRMRPNKSKVYPLFLSYNLYTTEVRKQLIKRGKTTTMTTIGQEDIANVAIALPSIKEQKRIAEFLKIVENKLIYLRKKKGLLEQYKKGVMQKIFSQEIRFKDENGKEFPKWEERKISEIFQINAGGDIDKKNFSKEKDGKFIYPVFSNSENNKGLFGYSDVYKIDQQSVTVTGRGALGYAVARYEKYYPIVRLLILTPIIKSDVFFYENLINTTNFFVESTGVPQLTAPQISNYKISYPHFAEQNKIAKFLSVIDDKINLVSEQIEKTKLWKKGLLQKMFC